MSSEHQLAFAGCPASKSLRLQDRFRADGTDGNVAPKLEAGGMKLALDAAGI